MGAKVLVIEDEAVHAQAAELLLRKAGHEVTVATSGEEGLRAARRLRPDLVLCDLVLPDVGGVYIVSRLRSDPQLAAVRVIAYTSLSAFDAGAAAGAGFDAFIAKPADPESFAREVAASLAR